MLSGTGSNIYTINIVNELCRKGHKVKLFCQDKDSSDLIKSSNCTVSIPDIDNILPVYVLDNYKNHEAKLFLDLSNEELNNYIEKNSYAIEKLVKSSKIDIAHFNHAVMGPYIASRTLSRYKIPYFVTIHGSDLEFTIRISERYRKYAHEGLKGAEKIVVPSRHIEKVLFEILPYAKHDLKDKIIVIPNGIDENEFTLVGDRKKTFDNLIKKLSDKRKSTQGFSESVDLSAADNLSKIDVNKDLIVFFAGKLISTKGVQFIPLIAPIITDKFPNAKFIIAGFGQMREELEKSCKGLSNIIFMGNLSHRELAPLLSISDVSLIPSVFPEAFGLVAIEASACGVIPIVANHSGLAEIADVLENGIQVEHGFLRIDTKPNTVVEDLAKHVIKAIEYKMEQGDKLKNKLREVTVNEFSWSSVTDKLVELYNDARKGIRKNV